VGRKSPDRYFSHDQCDDEGSEHQKDLCQDVRAVSIQDDGPGISERTRCWVATALRAPDRGVAISRLISE